MKDKTRRILTKILQSYNVSHYIACHLINEEHSHKHRMIIGTIIMFTGVTLVKLAHGHLLVIIVADVIGYLLHGIGAIPFVEHIIESKTTTDNEKETQVLEGKDEARDLGGCNNCPA